jgi:hypothetical protein
MAEFEDTKEIIRSRRSKNINPSFFTFVKYTTYVAFLQRS